MRHPEWGQATVSCPRDIEPMPEILIDWSWLTEEDKALARQGESAVFVEMDAAGENILRERKLLLRFLDAVSGGDGVAIFDVTAQKLWSPVDLKDELCHDADLDIMSLFTVHAISDDGTGDDGGGVCWIHTHGLADLGLVDFDLVQPGPGEEFAWRADGLRTISAAILEGEAAGGSGPFLIGYPNTWAEMVDINTFLKSATGYPADLLRGMVGGDEEGYEGYDEDHRRDHVVVCEPLSGGFLSRLFSGGRPRPLRYLWDDGVDDGMMCVSTDMTRLMEERARKSYGALRAMYDEFAEYEFSVLVKLGYETDNGDGNDREHMWFGVHGLDETEIDATLLNQPFDIAAMNEGDRGRHPVEKLTHWMIQTPMGSIDPQSFTAARMVRADPEAVREAMLEYAEDEE